MFSIYVIGSHTVIYPAPHRRRLKIGWIITGALADEYEAYRQRTKYFSILKVPLTSLI